MKREQGFYWVKFNFKWEVAEWFTFMSSNHWLRAGSENTWSDKNFDEINETRISEPE